eukprot:14504-Pelagomonas_calceolata.AAC.4
MVLCRSPLSDATLIHEQGKAPFNTGCSAMKRLWCKLARQICSCTKIQQKSEPKYALSPHLDQRPVIAQHGEQNAGVHIGRCAVDDDVKAVLACIALPVFLVGHVHQDVRAQIHDLRQIVVAQHGVSRPISPHTKEQSQQTLLTPIFHKRKRSQALHTFPHLFFLPSPQIQCSSITAHLACKLDCKVTKATNAEDADALPSSHEPLEGGIHCKAKPASYKALFLPWLASRMILLGHSGQHKKFAPLIFSFVVPCTKVQTTKKQQLQSYIAKKIW